MKNSRIYRFLLIGLGFVSLALGFAGIFLPVLPTTPFLLLSAALFSRSSDRFYRWLVNHRLFGSYIRNFLEHRTIPVRVKVISIFMLWISILASACFVPYFLLKIALPVVALAVTGHILSYKS